MPSSTANQQPRKRSVVSVSNSKRLRRTDLIKSSKDERTSRAIFPADSLRKITNIALSTGDHRPRTLADVYDQHIVDKKTSPAGSLDLIQQKSPALSLVHQQAEKTLPLVSSYGSDEECEKSKPNPHQLLPAIVTPLLPTSDLLSKGTRSESSVLIQQSDGKSNVSTRIVKLVVPQSIKMLSNTDGLSSALRIPTKIQLTKTLTVPSAANENQTTSIFPTTSILTINQQSVSCSQGMLSSTTTDVVEKTQSVVDYPLTPPPPVVETRNANSEQLNERKIQDLVRVDPGLNSKGNEESDPSASNEHQTISRRHVVSLSDWSVPPTSELSPTSLSSSSPDLSQNNFTPDEASVELHWKNHRSSMKRRYRSLSSSCPILPYYADKIKPITPPYKSKSLSRITSLLNKKTPVTVPLAKSTAVQRLRKRKKDIPLHTKRAKPRTKTEQENALVAREILNYVIEQIESSGVEKAKALKTSMNAPVSQLENAMPSNSAAEGNSESRTTTEQSTQNESQESTDELHPPRENNNQSTPMFHQSATSTRDDTVRSFDLTRQTSTPLSFHSIPSSSADDQSLSSPHSQSVVCKTHIFTDIVNELIKGAKGLDKLSCSLVTFTNSIHDFIRLTGKKQNETVEQLQHELNKKCQSRLKRAELFCTQKVQYFINKHSLAHLQEYIDGLTLIVKYFYLHVLSLNCRKQENEIEALLHDLVEGKLTFINETFCSPTLTAIIEDLILPSSLASDYLLAQPLTIGEEEWSLPFVRNPELEGELLQRNEFGLTSDLFSDPRDLEEYLQRCEHTLPSIPSHPPAQHPSHPPMYYPNYPHSSSSTPYYYHPTDMSSYYYPPTSPYLHAPPQQYLYNHPPPYYNSLTSYGTGYHTNEQYNYYYNQPTSYSYPHSNSTNDIPSVNNQQTYRRMNSNMQRKYSSSSSENPRTPAVFDTCNTEPTQSKSTTSSNAIYPS